MTIHEVVMYEKKDPPEITKIYQIVMNMTCMKGQAQLEYGEKRW